MKRVSERQLTKDNAEQDSSDDTDQVKQPGQFDRAPPEVIAKRRILKVRRTITTTNGTATNSNPFASNPFSTLATPTTDATNIFKTALANKPEHKKKSDDNVTQKPNNDHVVKGNGETSQQTKHENNADVNDDHDKKKKEEEKEKEKENQKTKDVHDVEKKEEKEEVKKSTTDSENKPEEKNDTDKEKSIDQKLESSNSITNVASDHDDAKKNDKSDTHTSTEKETENIPVSAKAIDSTTDTATVTPTTTNDDATKKKSNDENEKDNKKEGENIEADENEKKKRKVTFGGLAGSTPILTFASAAKGNETISGGMSFGFGNKSSSTSPDKGGVAFTFGTGNNKSSIINNNDKTNSIGGGSYFTNGGIENSSPKRKREFKEEKVETGEEGEDELFRSRAKLYVLEGKKEKARWKERGVGALKIKKAKDSKDARLLMRTEATLVVVLNSPLFPAITIDRASERSVRFQGFDLVDGSGSSGANKDKDNNNNKIEEEKEEDTIDKSLSSSESTCFLVRFATKEVVTNFEKTINDWKESISKEKQTNTNNNTDENHTTTTTTDEKQQSSTEDKSNTD